MTDYCVVAFHEDSSKWNFGSRHVRTACANHRGIFFIDGLPQGPYNVVAVPFLRGDDWNSGSWLRELQPLATKTFLTDGSAVDVSLKVLKPR